MNIVRNAFFIAAGLVAAFAPAVYADKPEQPPAGMGKYYVFLKQSPPVHPGQKPKKIDEPDIGKLGGRVLHSKDNYRVVFLPLPAVRQLRENNNVDYVQRVWMGESLETWEAMETAQTGRRLTTTADDDGPTWGPKAYAYDGSGNIRQIGTDAFSYDAVSRLKQAVVNGETESYEYDSFGNLTKKQLAGQPATTFSIDSASNRIANETYDIAGNVTFDGKRPYWYDAVGMMSGTVGSSGLRRMYYTADDERIGIQVDSTTSRWKIRDFEGRVLREFRTDMFLNGFSSASWFWTEDYVYAGSQLVGGETAGPWGVDNATVSADNRRRHYHLDHLGSVRLVTTDAKVSLGVHNYYPFGAEQSVFYQEEANFGGVGMIRPEPMRFTSHERDFNGLWNVDNKDYVDYMHARYYDPHGGRFLSVDPVLPQTAPLVPQAWNRYTYVLNNPLRFTDPTGLDPKCHKFKGEDGKERVICAETITVERKAPSRSFFNLELLFLESTASRQSPPTPGKSSFTPTQCRGLGAVVQRETRNGTRRAAAQSSNTWGDRAIGQFNVDFNTRGNPTLAGGNRIDLDWFTDINSYTADHTSLAPAAYVVGKIMWRAVGGTKGWPFQDSGETTAMYYAATGMTYNELYNQACP